MVLVKTSKIMNVEDIHAALNAGKTVNWSSKLYEIKQTSVRTNTTALQEHDINHHTTRNGLMLDCRCVVNYFGCLLTESELVDCFISEKES